MKKRICLLIVLLLLFTSTPAASFAGTESSSDQVSYIEIDGQRITPEDTIEVNALSAWREIAVYRADGTDISGSEKVKWKSDDNKNASVVKDGEKFWIRTQKAEVGKTVTISASDEDGNMVSVRIKLTSLSYENNSCTKNPLKVNDKAALNLIYMSPDRNEIGDTLIGNYIADHVKVESTNEDVLPVSGITIYKNSGISHTWKLVAIAEGSTTVTFSVDDEYLKWEYSVDLATETGLILSKNKLFMEPGQKENLGAEVKPAGSAKGDTIFASNDENIATVSADGEVTAVGNGDTEIIVKNGDLEAKAVVSVRKTGIYKKGDLQPLDKVEVKGGEQLELEACYKGMKVQGVQARWQSDNTGVIDSVGASEMDGKFAPAANGNARIRALQWDLDAGTAQEIASIEVVVTGCSKDAPDDPEENYAELNGAQGNYASGKIQLNDYRILYNTVNQMQYENYITAPAIDPTVAVFEFTFTGTGKNYTEGVDEADYSRLLKPHVKLVNASGKTIATVGDGMELKVTGSNVDSAPQADVRLTIAADRLAAKQKYALIFDYTTPAPIINTAEALIFKETAYNFTTGDIVVRGIALNKTKLTITKGSTEKLQAVFTPENPAIKDISWTSSNASIASVDQTGTVTATAVGTAVITATAKDGGYKASCEITVQEPQTMRLQVGKVTKGKASSAGHNAIKVSWKSVENADGYQIYRASGKNGTYKKVKTTKKTTYINKKLKTGKTYYFKVRAYQTVGGTTYYGKFSSAVSAKPRLSSPALKVKAGKKKASVRWSSVAGAQQYQVYRAASKNGKYIKIRETRSRSYTNKGLKSKKTYYYKVRAYKKADGKKMYSKYSRIVKAKAK